MIPPDEVLRGRDVVDALRAFGARDAVGLAQGLSAPMARACLDAALAPLTIEALSGAAMAHPGRGRPESVAVVVARGVFTSPVEWTALYAVAGIRVALKAPSADPAACAALAEDLSARGLPVSLCGPQDLGEHEVIVVFGSDGTGAELAAAWPERRVVRFGHRVSAAAVEVPTSATARRALATALAWDVAAYDSRGCMAPVAILAAGDAAALAADLDLALGALDARLPRGVVDPALGPEWRRRLALARVLGRCHEGAGHAVLELPAGQLVPAALPRLAAVHPVPVGDLSALDGLPLSSLAVTAGFAEAARSRAPRVVGPGTLQQPTLPRKHDGVEMLGCVLRSG